MSLTREELDVLDLTVKLWNAIGELPTTPDQQRDACNAIHQIQRIVAARVCSRMLPEVWKK